MTNDSLGDRMKEKYEFPETEPRFLPMLPVYARIDGRGFSRFTKGMNRPYDTRMTNAMIQTTKTLVDQTKACIGYVQSDEISLVWYEPDPKTEMMFDGKKQKLVSVLAGLATVGFIKGLQDNFPVEWMTLLNKLPHFDCRVFQLPTLAEAANAFLWRNLDATKNAVSMAAHHYFSHNSLHGMRSAEMQERLFQEKQINFNDYPSSFRRGVFVRRELVVREISELELERIPVQNRPEEGATFTRSVIKELTVPPLNRVVNRVGFIFHGEEPLEKSDDETVV